MKSSVKHKISGLQNHLSFFNGLWLISKKVRIIKSGLALSFFKLQLSQPIRESGIFFYLWFE
jgi:hypothetical protein